jgi:hypothetical protein
MGSGSGVSRGDRNRNVRLERLRALVPDAVLIASPRSCAAMSRSRWMRRGAGCGTWAPAASS